MYVCICTVDVMILLSDHLIDMKYMALRLVLVTRVKS